MLTQERLTPHRLQNNRAEAAGGIWGIEDGLIIPPSVSAFLPKNIHKPLLETLCTAPQPSTSAISVADAQAFASLQKTDS